MTKTHELKCDPEPFFDLLTGKKHCEVRRDDRGFREGDRLWLRETSLSAQGNAILRQEARYTGRELYRTITHIQRGYGLPDGLVVLSVSAAPERAQPAGEAEPEATIFAWATFDGEGSYDLRLFEENESYRRDYIDRNGAKYADWVMPLYRVAAPPAAANQAGIPEMIARWFALVDGAAAALEDASNHCGTLDSERAALGAANHYREQAQELYDSSKSASTGRCFKCGHAAHNDSCVNVAPPYP